jgi:hypothetical protein
MLSKCSTPDLDSPHPSHRKLIALTQAWISYPCMQWVHKSLSTLITHPVHLSFSGALGATGQQQVLMPLSGSDCITDRVLASLAFTVISLPCSTFKLSSSWNSQTEPRPHQAMCTYLHENNHQLKRSDHKPGSSQQCSLRWQQDSVQQTNVQDGTCSTHAWLHVTHD